MSVYTSLLCGHWKLELSWGSKLPSIVSWRKKNINSSSRNKHLFWLNQFSFASFFWLDFKIYTQRDAHQGLSLSNFPPQFKIFMDSSCDCTFLPQPKFPFFIIFWSFSTQGLQKGWSSAPVVERCSYRCLSEGKPMQMHPRASCGSHQYSV